MEIERSCRNAGILVSESSMYSYGEVYHDLPMKGTTEIQTLLNPHSPLHTHMHYDMNIEGGGRMEGWEKEEKKSIKERKPTTSMKTQN